MSDAFCTGLLRNERIVVGVAMTTHLCRDAQTVHGLAATSAIAMGRLLTATVLTGLIQERPGSLSLQVLGSGRIKQIFADITREGAARGYIKPSDLAMPPLTDAQRHGRRTLSHAVAGGTLSVIRTSEDETFTQSATELVSGELDLDVAHFLESSDQISCAVAADTLLNEEDAVCLAGGAIAQAMPGADLERLGSIKARFAEGKFLEQLSVNEGSAQDLLSLLFSNVEPIEPVVPLRWQCRCSHTRVLDALKILDPMELAELVDGDSPVDISCDFCGKAYTVSPAEVREVYESTIKAEG